MKFKKAKLQEFILHPKHTILDGVNLINSASKQFALIVDNNYKLLGTLNDGDVRRAILKGCSLNDSVKTAMYTSPIVAHQQDSLQLLYKNTLVKFIPIIDDSSRVVDLYLVDIGNNFTRDNLVVLMAGGMGTRLHPLTKELPKPLIKIGGKPILLLILERFISLGFNRFILTVNYKSEMIIEYFGDGSRWNVSIEYVHEPKQLGTAGSLSLISDRPSTSFIVMNADLVTSLDYRQLLDFHLEHKSLATMCVREYDYEIPYGVIEIKDNCVHNIEEKPLYKYFVNAGIYVLEPEVLDLLSSGLHLDMTQLFGEILKENKPVVFPIREYWMDIGKKLDLEKARLEIDPKVISKV